MKEQNRIPIKEQKRIRDDGIRRLYRAGYSYNQICSMMNLSKTTVFFAVNHPTKGRNAGKNKTKNKN